MLNFVNRIASKILRVPIDILWIVSIGLLNDSPTDDWPAKLYISLGLTRSRAFFTASKFKISSSIIFTLSLIPKIDKLLKELFSPVRELIQTDYPFDSKNLARYAPS